MPVIPALHDHDLSFPPASQALDDPNGLLAWGGDLSVPRLLQAYRQGIFPWYSEPDPILWWSPDPRALLLPESLHVPRSLARLLRKQRFRVTVDQDFARVMTHCADGSSLRRDPGTWITPAMQQAYTALHAAGHGHSVEVWQDETLVGGLYGLAIGRVFFGESMFSHVPDASRTALVCLARWLFAAGFALIDCQVGNPHTQGLGACHVPRRQFLARLTACAQPTPIQDWRSDISGWQRPCR